MRLIEHFYRFIAPHDCLVCHKEGDLICKGCVSTALPYVPSRCYRCYKSLPSSLTCPKCRKYSLLKQVWVRTDYNDMAKQLMHCYKFGYAKDVSAVIAGELIKLIPNLPESIVIVHVPAATSHVRQRGFDQSALIARQLALSLDVIHINALSRLGQQHQVGSIASLRLKQMNGAFRCIYPSLVEGAHILLVDDVLTTGSTLEAAAQALKKAGAKTISAICFAQVN